mgnify:CR=1 FL=1
MENKVRGESLGYQARRHAQRLVSDCFCRGILRVPNETCKLNDNVPDMPRRARRWVGEMEEIAATFDHVGVTPGFHQGAAAIFRLFSQTPFADETPETRDTSRTLAQTIAAAAKLLPPRVESAD